MASPVSGAPSGGGMATAEPDALRQHYRSAGSDDAMIGRVMHALAALGPGALTAAQLAPLDQFHVRGLAASAELAQLAGLTAGMRALDAGCGLGGPARLLAETAGCQVTGIDLSPSFVAVARALALRSTVADKVGFEVADMTALPFVDAQFDCVWTQHALMNVGRRLPAYGEFRRVLGHGGRLACYDVIAADGKPDVIYPTPWAPRPELSHLLTRAETLGLLEQAGFALHTWVDASVMALSSVGHGGAAPQGALNLSAVMGPGFPAMAGKLARNLREGRVRLAMAVFDLVPGGCAAVAVTPLPRPPACPSAIAGPSRFG